MANDGVGTGTENDLAKRVTHLVESVVEAIRDRSLRPVLSVIRWLIIGVVVGLVAAVALVVIVIGLFRLFDHDVFAGRAWATDLLFGGIFVAAGMFIFSLGNRSRRHRGTS
jgi:hypothetical protein